MKGQGRDRISTVPQPIIETVLCLLPIKDAARTSILSREWRYKWTTIPKLVISESMVSSTAIEEKQQSERGRKHMDRTSKLFYAIYQVLLLRQAPIQEFSLKMCSIQSCFEIDQIIFHLSRSHTVKKLELDLKYDSLPLSLFSLHQLTDLSLNSCNMFDHKPVFKGFDNLTSLSLEMVWIPMESLLHLLSVCPSLKSFTMVSRDDNIIGDYFPTVMEFFKCLPVLEDLTISRSFTEYGVQFLGSDEELPVTLVHLKYFCFEQMKVGESNGWTFLSSLITCSPNLEIIKLKMFTDDDDLNEESVIFKEWPDVWLEHLNELDIDYFENHMTELEFVKFILARSLNLKKVILRTYMDNKNEELEMLKILLCAPRASPVKIIVENRYTAQ